MDLGGWEVFVLNICWAWFIFTLFLLLSQPMKDDYERQWRNA